MIYSYGTVQIQIDWQPLQLSGAGLRGLGAWLRGASVGHAGIRELRVHRVDLGVLDAHQLL